MAREVRFKKELLDELLAGQDAKTVFEQDGLLDDLKKALAERILNAEMDVHLGQDAEQSAGNHRNGVSPKTVLTDSGKLELAIPRDRQGRFEPALIAKYQRRFPGFDQKIIALYARGMTTRDIQGHLRELYGIEISPELVSAVTDAVLDEVSAWQARPLEPVYAIVFFDCLRIKIRDEGAVKNKAVYLAIGMRCSGHKEVLGIWYGASRLFVNFFQPSFKLAAKHRDGAKITKRCHPPQTPCDRLLQSDATSIVTKTTLQEIAAGLDPLKLLEEKRAVQAYLAALADGESPPPNSSEPPDLAAFVASLSSAWHLGEIRPTFSVEAKPKYLRGLSPAPAPDGIANANVASPTPSSVTSSTSITAQKKPQPIYADPGQARVHALRMVWPIVARRLEDLPNINASQLFDELCVKFPGRFTRKQYNALLRVSIAGAKRPASEVS